ncbi:MAG: tetratricopeptide repeat protein [Planctomycetota bacterium]|nr:tetratricopeptide repeat protein [Planctomycetota bacterium]
MDEDLFRIQTYDEVILKDGTSLKGTIIETDDKAVVKIRLPSNASRIIQKEEIRETKRKSGPDNILDNITTKYGNDPVNLAANVRHALSQYGGIEAKALAVLEKASAKGHKDILILLCERYLNAGKTSEAEGAAKRLIEHNSGPDGQRLLGLALSSMGKNEEALAALKKAKELAPEDEDVLVALAQVQLAMGKADDAKKVFDDALAKNPNLASANVGLGYVLLRNGSFAEAAQAFEKVPSNAPKPQLIKAKIGLGACKIMLKDFDAAYKLGDEALTMDNRSSQAYGIKGFARLMTGDAAQLPTAFRYIDESLHEDPNNPRMKIIKAVALDRAAQFDDVNGKGAEAKTKRDEAAKILAEMDGIKTNDAWIKYLMAELRYEQKEYDLASSGFEEAAQLAPNFAPAHQAKGALLLRSRKWTEAADSYKKAIALDGSKADHYAGLGLAMLGATNLPEAQKQFKKALEIDARNVPALCGLGYIANYEKDEKRASEMFQQAIAADGTCAYAADALARIFAQRDLQFDYLTFENNADPAGWSAKGGRQVKATVANGAILFYGSQGMTGSGKIEYHTPLEARDFVRLEADFQVSPENAGILGLRIASRAGSAVNFELEFGKDNAKHIAYRFRDYSGTPPDWHALPDPWPDSGRVRLAIETQDLKTGMVELFVNGVSKGKLPLKLTNPTRITAGIVCELPEKEAIDAKVDNIALLRRKLPDVEGPKSGELIPTDPKQAPKEEKK